MLHKGKPRIFDASVRASDHSRTSSTFTTGKNPHLTKSNNKLHSKSTYFYNDDSSSGDASSSSLASFQRHPVGLCLLRVNCKSQDFSSRNAHPAQPGNDVLWKDCRRKNLGKASRLTYLVPSACVLALLVGGIITFNPTLDNSKVYAEELDFDASNADSISNDSGIMTASDPSITLDITPDSGNTNSNVTVGEVAYFSNTVTVGGTGISKYYLTLSTPSGSTGNLVGQKNPASTVGKVDYGTAPANFPDNTWGYAVSDNTSTANTSLTYNPVPSGTSGNNSAYLVAKNSAPATSGDKYKLVFAAKLSSNMPGDHYQSNVYVSAVANAEQTVNNWFRNAGITTMQEMNSALCKGAPENATSQLIDSRDNKLYWVTKLKDGNCWMTQNLAYDGGGIEQCALNGGTTCSGWSSTDDNVASYAKGTHTEAGVSAHTSQGNFYSWAAAMNGNISASEPAQGICPGGWQLPASNNTDSKSFGGLVNAYGIGSAGSKLAETPLFFQYCGYVDNRQLYNAGSSGGYWSPTPYDANRTYYLTFGSSNVNPSSYSLRYVGYSVRCVAK